MTNERFFHARVSLHWGFVVRSFGATAAQTALALPPPTAIVGAFATPLLRLLGARDRYAPTGGSGGDVTTKRRGKKVVERASASPLFGCILDATLAASAGLYPQGRGAGLGIAMEPSRLIAAPYKGSSERKRIKEGVERKNVMEAMSRALPVQAVGAAYGVSTLLDLAWVVDVRELADCLNNVAGVKVETEDIDN
ncbi:MAG: hypothetical protein ACK4SY_10510, partial [Pyrobaculum sp.]